MTLEAPISEIDMKKIKQHVQEKTGFDLSYFKPTFLSRRVNVRMKVLHVKSGSEYAKLLHSNPEEINSLYDSLSINVTKFFRDLPVWTMFSKKILPRLEQNLNGNNTIRIWSSGCASGEEAYSIAIMFHEYFENSDYKIKIIATDINADLLNIAKKGIYSSEEIKGLDPEIKRKYFKKLQSDKYQINKDIRNTISFHTGDIVTFPVSYLDVIFCRNLLIYYGKDAQDLIFKKFHQVLKETRFLVLGIDESMLGHKVSKSFMPIFPRERIYQKRSSRDMLSSFITENTKWVMVFLLVS